MDADDNTAYNISTRQTPVVDDPNNRRMDWYLEYLEESFYLLWQAGCFIVYDGHYQKVTFVDLKSAISASFMYQTGWQRNNTPFLFICSLL